MESTVTAASTQFSSPATTSQKDPNHFIIHEETCLETRPEYLDDFITHNERFFVRSNGKNPQIDLASYRLIIEGDALQQPLALRYADLRALPSHTLFSALECAGNHRAMFDLVNNQPTEDAQWKTGAIGNASWTGVPLREVLTLADLRADAVDVMLIGLDTSAPEAGFRRVMPIAKALEPDTLLAYSMNGSVLPADHGFPIRVVAPGWVGASSIKWLGRIVVSTKRQWARNNLDYYVMIGENFPPEGESDGIPLGEQSIKSALSLPWPAMLSPGTHTIRGYAVSPGIPIASVEWSIDDGASWHLATVLSPQLQYSWARFEFKWQAMPGEYHLLTRATDTAGNKQPDTIPFNEKGYLFNQPVPHPITVR